MNRDRISILALIIFGAITASFAQDGRGELDQDDRVKRIDSTLTALVPQGLDGVMLIRRRNKVLIHKAYGFADRDTKKPMQIDTGFDIGSIVKPMTQVAILKLEEMGRLSTADTIGKYFKVPDDKKGITIEHLLKHTSGLPDTFGGDYQVVTREWIVAQALASKLLGPPGGERRYSNSGYSLLAAIIELVSGKAYEAFVRENVFAPAGIKGIGYRLAGWKNEGLAVGFYDGKRWGTPLDKKWADDGPGWNLRGNGGMLSSAAQQNSWFEALFEGKVLKPAALDKYLANAAGTSRTLGVRVIGPAGGNDVFNSLQVSLVDHDFHFTFFTSNSQQPAERIFETIRDDVMALARDSIDAKSAGTSK